MSPGTGATQSVVVTLWVKRGRVLIVPSRHYARAVMVYSRQQHPVGGMPGSGAARLRVRRMTVMDLQSGTTTTETIYRKQIRPVIIGGAEVMDRLFPGDSPEAGPDASGA